MKIENSKFLPFITGLFTVVLVLSNTLDTKIFTVFSLNLPAGIILFPLGYVFGDILTEVYGFKESRKVIWTGFVALLLMVVVYDVGIALKPADFWKDQEHFAATLSHVPRLVTASIIAYFSGEFCNSYVIAKLKLLSSGRHMAIRFIASTLAGQGVDTIVFVSIAFIGVLPSEALPGIILAGWAFKVCWEIIVLPISLPITKWLKKAENIDVYDRDTNFNPFHISSN